MSDSDGDTNLMGRRLSDAVAQATAIAELKGELRTLTQAVTNSANESKTLIRLVEQQIEYVQKDQKGDRVTQQEIKVELNKDIAELRLNLMEELKEHTHADDNPHSSTIGKRLGSLESSRTYMKGMLAVGALVMPTITGLIFKWLGVVS